MNKTLRPLTPKEFSEAVGGLLAPCTVREKCRNGELPTVNGPKRPPYYIKPDALAPYRPTLERFLVAL